MTTNSGRQYALAAGDGPSMQTPTDDQLTIKAGAGNTNNLLTILELQSDPMHGPPLHIHHREDEVWYVLDGEFRFRVGDEHYRLSTGGMAFGPRDMPHCFQNIGGGPGRLVFICTPAGAEGFFEEFAGKRSTLPGPAGTELLTELGHGFDVDFIGPPLAESHPL